ncbi:hypothetical protein JRQ81_013168 [Phrynocephalus forsythii]|uniref:START domain-containing protein n=1 Tax=Phrynocephalus forsythii TaxID=171643 RepID=A0A9Q0XZB4_9SAUR|nr:hypothetical protein JRQ81_013168 [Phrynocephalus forsythii]
MLGRWPGKLKTTLFQNGAGEQLRMLGRLPGLFPGRGSILSSLPRPNVPETTTPGLPRGRKHHNATEPHRPLLLSRGSCGEEKGWMMPQAAPKMDYKKTADEVCKKVLSYVQEDTAGWKVIKRTKHISVVAKPSEDFCGTLYRAEAQIEVPAENLFPFIYLPEYREKWDKAVQSYKLVETIDQVIQTLSFFTVLHTVTALAWYPQGTLSTCCT